MSTTDEKCTGSINEKGEHCTVCRQREMPGYWCDVCEREVAEKRCPLCGLKARKIREKN